MTFTPMKDLKGYMTPEQCRKVVESADTGRDRTLLQLLWRTGARISEVLGLTVDNFVYSERILVIRTLKRRKKKGKEVIKMRRIPIDQETADILHDYIKKNGLKEGIVFVGSGKLGHITRQTAWYIVRKCGKKCGIEKVGDKGIHPHHMRHSYAVEWIKTYGEKEIRKLQMILGHSSVTTTYEYLQFGPFELRDKFDGMIKGED